MEYVSRLVSNHFKHHLQRGKSLLLLGPRQTGKSTLVHSLNADLEISLVSPSQRQKYEKNAALLSGEIEHIRKKKPFPLIVIDEIQKVPLLMDSLQEIIDKKMAQFVITGSSARKLRRGININLLPGRLVLSRLDPFVHQEYAQPFKQTLYYGSLPGIVGEKEDGDKEIDLKSYVESYLEEEVRSEALVRNIGQFACFLEYAGLESGKLVSFRAISQEIGVSHTTIASYFEILEDCLIMERIDPITKSLTRKKLIKSNRYLFFDLGVRRLSAIEGVPMPRTREGEIFEQYAGLELIRYARIKGNGATVKFWRDAEGPEVDWVIERNRKYTPIEVKMTSHPTSSDVRHVKTFLSEYKNCNEGYLVCMVERPVQLDDRITAMPWQTLSGLFEKEKEVKTEGGKWSSSVS